MKHTHFIIIIIACWPALALAQHITNPDTIYQAKDIILQNTDVYYNPFAPPDPSDTAWNLSSIASELRDPDGVRSYTYAPRTHGIEFPNWQPHGKSLFPGVWMRLFTAKNKSDGSPSDIIVGDSVTNDTTVGPVIISAMEDVDFRATGTIKMENGFHIMPGAYFHAYIAPTFDTAVFSDEFDSPSLAKWVITNGHGGNTDMGPECSSDTNVQSDVMDADAFDSHALRIDLKDDTCNCYEQDEHTISIVVGGDTVAACSDDSVGASQHHQFTTGIFLSCPWPFASSDTPLKPAYQNAPYGKYEVREKIPNFAHHTNNWGDGQSDEWNLDERYSGILDQLQPGPTRRWEYGPYKGLFSYDSIAGQTVFHSSSANFALWNNPTHLIINNFLYEVALTIDTLPQRDTFLTPTGTTVLEGGFPSSLTGSTDSITFYYTLWGGNHVSDTLPWSLDSTGTYFTSPYAVNHGDSLHFTKSYQPTSIGIRTRVDFRDTVLFFACHWDHITGKVIFTPPIPDSISHSGSSFTYNTDEGPDYPVPGILIDTSGEKYHTYTMEFLPHEARFLYDGAVMRRWPDRLIPKTDQRGDYITWFPRTPMNIRIAEIDIDGDPADTSSGSIYYKEKADFEAKYGVGGTASHHIDYVKIWDLPAGSNPPSFPK